MSINVQELLPAAPLAPLTAPFVGMIARRPTISTGGSDVKKHNLKVVDRDWTPKRNGRFYCSPACGKFCTFADFEKVTRDANKLAARMGEGWEPVVWENLSWHYRAENGPATIYGPRGTVKTYSAWIEFGELRNRTIQIIEDAETPEDALGFATQKARTLASKITSALDRLANT